MLTKKQIKEIRDLLDNSNNPFFLFDNDPDGLCSFLLLRKYAGKGKGFPIKSFPELDKSYFKRAQELGADCIFILDKPVVSKDFFEEAKNANLPVAWLDHHEQNHLRVSAPPAPDRKSRQNRDGSALPEEIPNFVHYYNPLYNRKKSEEPVTALCYQINGDKNLVWLAVAGCVSDKFLPRFYKDCMKKYPELTLKTKNAYDVFFNSQIGKIARIFSFALKDKTTNVVSMMKFLMKANTPYEVLEDSPANYSMHKRFEQIEVKYQKLLKKAIAIGNESGKVLFFQYGGDLSISSDLSNQLIYIFPDKTIVVIYISGMKANVSVRGKNVRDKLAAAIEGLAGATGGGHKDAAGGQMKVSDIEIFKKRFSEK